MILIMDDVYTLDTYLDIKANNLKKEDFFSNKKLINILKASTFQPPCPN